ncbi:MAG TPA: LysR family transcriptional regulator [Rhodocyclaceae bacterium]|nr:LysR family transcriptional regulator [Rhodocyclaceae bacterium]
MKNVTLRQLKVFEAVANHLSFSRAAEELYLTQPAVSMQVQALADQVGLPLFEQMGKKIFLTAAGEELLRHVRRIAQQLREADEALAAIRGAKGGRLTLGVVSTAKYVAPRLLVAFSKLHPEADLRLGVYNRETLVHQLAENQIDLAIMGTPPKEVDTVAAVFADHPHVIIAAADHPLAARRRLSPADLADQPFLIREPGSGTRGAMERFFAGHGVQITRTTEMGSNETIKQAVMAGMGLSFISEHTIGLELAAGRLVRLPVTGTPVMRQWFVVHRADKQLLPMSIAFLDFVRSDGPRLVAEQAPIAPATDARGKKR